MPCNRFCRKCGCPLDCDHDGSLCCMCLSDSLAPECDTFPWCEPAVDEDEDENVPNVDHVRG